MGSGGKGKVGKEEVPSEDEGRKKRKEGERATRQMKEEGRGM